MKICLKCEQYYNAKDWICPRCGWTSEVRDGFTSFSPFDKNKPEGYDPIHFRYLVDLEPKNFWFVSRNKLIQWAFQKYFSEANNFFEIGCGTGFVLWGLQNCNYELNLIGGDLFTQGLHYAKLRVPEATFFQMDARSIPFEDEYDVIGAFDVLEHVVDDGAVLKQMHQACKNDGGIMISVPQHEFLWSPADDHAQHVRRYNRHELESKLNNAGFEIIRITSFVSLLFPFMFISRMIKRKEKKEYDPLSELKISCLLNTIFLKILDFELRFIRLGISFPLGGSLFAIARKKSVRY